MSLPDTIFVIVVGAVAGLFVLLMTAFAVVYGALWLAAAVVRTAAAPRAPLGRPLPPRLRTAAGLSAGPAPSSAEHWTARSLS